MKIKKILLLSIFCFLLSGCTVEYNLDIDNAVYKENVDITSTGEENKEWYNLLKEWSLPSFYQDIDANNDQPNEVEGISYYKKKTNNRDLNVNFKYNFKQEEYGSSTLAHFCYNNFFAHENEEAKTVNYTASMDFKCFDQYPDLEKVIVKLKTNHKMINNNADRKENDTYIWEITPENARGKYIFFEINKKSPFGFLTILKYVLIGLGCLAILGLLFIIYFRRKWVKANRI